MTDEAHCSEADFDQVTAAHEAGHVVVSAYFNIRFRRVWLYHPKKRCGVVIGCHQHLKSDAAYHRWLEDDAIVLFAGALAERRYEPRSNWREGMGIVKLYYGNDLEQARKVFHEHSSGRGTAAVTIARVSRSRTIVFKKPRDTDLHYIDDNLARLDFSCREDRDIYQSLLMWRAAALVDRLWPDIQRVARALLEQKVLTEAQVHRLINRARR